jgi:hypothetical protein
MNNTYENNNSDNLSITDIIDIIDKLDKTDVDKINNNKMNKILDDYNSIFNNIGYNRQNKVCDDHIILERMTRRKSFMKYQNQDLIPSTSYRTVMKNGLVYT